MPVEFIEGKLKTTLPVHLVAKNRLDAAALASSSLAWARANGFSGQAGRTLILPGENGALAGALF
ncbi:MAG: leucyl aminopeptidase family protein, partial [Mesorhizobium sp.]